MATRQQRTLRICAWLIPIFLVGLSFGVTEPFNTERIVYLTPHTPWTPPISDYTNQLTDGDANTIWHTDHLRYFGIENFLFIHFPSDQVKRANQQKNILCFSVYPRLDAPTNTFKSISFSGSNNGIFFTNLGTYSATELPQITEKYSSCTKSIAYNVVRVSFMNGYRAHRFYSIADLFFDFSKVRMDSQNLAELPGQPDTLILKVLSKISKLALALSTVFLVISLSWVTYIVSKQLRSQSTFADSVILSVSAILALFIVFNPHNWFNIIFIGIISFFIHFKLEPISDAKL